MRDDNPVVEEIEDEKELQALARKRIIAAHQLLAKWSLRPESESDADIDIWALQLRASLTDAERARLFDVLATSFAPDHFYFIAKRHLDGAGAPTLGLLDDPTADAKFWADMANTKELTAYAAVSFNRMSPSRQSAFLKWAGEKKK